MMMGRIGENNVLLWHGNRLLHHLHSSEEDHRQGSLNSDGTRKGAKEEEDGPKLMAQGREEGFFIFFMESMYNKKESFISPRAFFSWTHQ
jgi:hypothetical protein